MGVSPGIDLQVANQHSHVSTAVALPSGLPNLHRETHSPGYSTPESDPVLLQRVLAAKCGQTVRSSPSAQESQGGPVMVDLTMKHQTWSSLP